MRRLLTYLGLIVTGFLVDLYSVGWIKIINRDDTISVVVMALIWTYLQYGFLHIAGEKSELEKFWKMTAYAIGNGAGAYAAMVLF